MAGDWLQIRCDLPDDPDVIAIAEDLEITEEQVVGCLVKVWSWFSNHTINGDAPGVTKKRLDRIAGVTGFCEAMENRGWFVEKKTGCCIPNFYRYMSNSSKKRALSRIRQEKYRNKTLRSERNESNASGVTKRREEKRKEEEKRREEDVTQTLRSERYAEKGDIRGKSLEVAEYYGQVLSRQGRTDSQRISGLSTIDQRVMEGYSVEDLKKAADRYSLDVSEDGIPKGVKTFYERMFADYLSHDWEPPADKEKLREERIRKALEE